MEVGGLGGPEHLTAASGASVEVLQDGNSVPTIPGLEEEESCLGVGTAPGRGWRAARQEGVSIGVPLPHRNAAAAPGGNENPLALVPTSRKARAVCRQGGWGGGLREAACSTIGPRAISPVSKCIWFAAN